MSDPVSNHDIEDVLSSIRKLVAQGDHTAKHDHDVPAIGSREPANVIGRLVLTPAFRVADVTSDSSDRDCFQLKPQLDGSATSEVTSAPEPEKFWTEDILTPVGKPNDRASLEATIAELEAAVTETSDDWEPDGSERVIENIVTSAFLYKLDARQAKKPEDIVTSAVKDHIVETIADEIEISLPFEEARFAKVEVVTDAEPARPDTAKDSVQADMAPVALPSDEEIEFSHKRFSEVYDPLAEATADAAEAELGDVYGDELTPDVDPVVGAVSTSANVQLVDPDALRALVGDMIRQELQGEMGERITRNVRKLVRREINRVITEQEV
jgi:hypothetical protein